jgi:hypothetical protein
LVRTYDLDPDFVAGIDAELEAKGTKPEKGPEPKAGGRGVFAFCEGTTCAKCPYAPVCGFANPGLKKARE